jgi:hypothetical protein
MLSECLLIDLMAARLSLRCDFAPRLTTILTPNGFFSPEGLAVCEIIYIFEN